MVRYGERDFIAVENLSYKFHIYGKLHPRPQNAPYEPNYLNL